MITILPITLGLLGLALLLGATVYESVVMAPNYEANIPDSLDLARRFLSRATPASYFRVVAPGTLLVLLASLAICWANPPARWGLLGGAAALGIGDVITFAFHYPRLATMFQGPLSLAPELLGRAAREWAAGNLVRAVLLIAAFLSVLYALVAMTGGSFA